MLEIEDKIKNINKKEIIIGSFSLLGIGGILAGSPIALLITTFPLLISGLSTYYRFKKNQNFSLDTTLLPIYKKTFNKWMEKYLNTEDLTEKKYKLLFLNAWCDFKRIKLSDMQDYSKDILGNIALELLTKKETKHHLCKLVFHSTYDNNIEYHDFLTEDINNSEKLEKAKNIYKDFSNYGIVGNGFRFLNAGSFKFLIEIQDYQLTKEDLINLKKQIEILKKEPEVLKSDILVCNEDANIFIKLIQNNNIETVLTLKYFFKEINFTSLDGFTKEYFIDLIDKKINYNNLNDEILEKNIIHSKTKKLKI